MLLVYFCTSEASERLQGTESTDVLSNILTSKEM